MRNPKRISNERLQSYTRGSRIVCDQSLMLVVNKQVSQMSDSKEMRESHQLILWSQSRLQGYERFIALDQV